MSEIKQVEPRYILPFMGIPMHLIVEDSAFTEIAFDIISECNNVTCTEAKCKEIAEAAIMRRVGANMKADKQLSKDLKYILLHALDYDDIEVEEDVVCVRVLIDAFDYLRVEVKTLHPKKNGGTP